ncbi:cytochrome P450 family protein [Saccharibacillus alkalitolerans]|uniref:Cytochrome P450 n=1 Tax=Saccharibacillus alkalitolerans TaxID=2705290 RepID=A0ABX0F103_9BACL|nr:cytochrome P450 [Saccharibacillus alkalitolerans]NGZ74662.1 cytochrome P450 [Saccharibacillus alkalitolerans]
MNEDRAVTAEQAASGIFNGENGLDPFAVFAQMRQAGPILSVPVEMGGVKFKAWMVTRFDEAMQVLKDHGRFTVDRSALESGSSGGESFMRQDESSPATFFTGKSMLTVDEPDHRRLRGLVSKAFTPKYMESLRPRVQGLADSLLDRVQSGGEMDLVRDYAYPLPINVICDMLGIPEEDHADIRLWSGAIAHGLGLGRQEPEVAEHLRAFGEYTARLVHNKRSRPGDDLISQLIALEEEGDRLSEQELYSMITLLVFAGHETTSNLIATGCLMLLDHPDELAKLKADLSLVPSAVEELLRFNGPSTIAGPRYALEDTEIAGQPIRRGEMIFPVLKSANRDELKFDASEELDLTRSISRHLAFGNGIHMCLGAPLARIEADVAFSTLLRRMPELRLAIPREDVAWSFALSSQGLAALPVKF